MPQPKIIIPLQPQSVIDVRNKIRTAEKKADLLEIWLDGVEDLYEEKVRQIVRLASKPLIVNLKDKAERGTFRGDVKKRLELLGMAVAAGAQFVDLPLTLPPNLIREFRRAYPKVKLILSWHDFSGMPNLQKLRVLAKKADSLGADIIKLVGTAKQWSDNLPILQITDELATKKKTCLTMAMGEKGRLTRVLTPLLGGFGMFATLDRKSATAPGQLTAGELKKWWEDFS